MQFVNRMGPGRYTKNSKESERGIHELCQPILWSNKDFETQSRQRGRISASIWNWQEIRSNSERRNFHLKPTDTPWMLWYNKTSFFRCSQRICWTYGYLRDMIARHELWNDQSQNEHGQLLRAILTQRQFEVYNKTHKNYVLRQWGMDHHRSSYRYS